MNMSEWQPIETAPRDGIQFLVWARVEINDSLRPKTADDVPPTYGCFMASYYKRDSIYDDEKAALLALGPRLVVDVRGMWRTKTVPTHWMPLPGGPRGGSN